MTDDRAPIAVWYEHPRWFRPLFDELERRGLPHERIRADEHAFDPSGGGGDPGFALLLNRMSPSAHLRGHGAAVAQTLAYLEHLGRLDVRIVNGPRAFRTEISKARQVDLLDALGIPHPATRVVDRPGRAPAAARELRWPVVVKPNRGGSGAGVRRFDEPAELRAAAEADELELGPDGVGLVQEFVPARGGHIVRVEVLGGEVLYAIRVHLDGETFDLCPADICRTADGEELEPDTAAPGAAETGLSVEAFEPPPPAARDAVRIARAAGVEVGGVEYLVDDRDGTRRFYDVNALSNFVAEPERVLGFDPFERLVDWLAAEAWGEAAAAEAADGPVSTGRGSR